MIIRSLKLDEAEEKAFNVRIDKAREQLDAINARKRGKKRPTCIEEVQRKAESILQHYRVAEFFDCRVQEISRQTVLRRYQDRPEQTIEEKEFRVVAVLNETALEKAKQRLGWRVYATNHSVEELPLEKAVLAYRNEYIIERGFARLKGNPLSMAPTYLQKGEHVTGLVRLLSIALRLITLVEFSVRRSLARRKSTLAGLYPGNPKRSTATPTTELILQAFKDIYFSVVRLPDQDIVHVTSLSDLQQRILKLLDFSADIYQRLSRNLTNSISN